MKPLVDDHIYSVVVVEVGIRRSSLTREKAESLARLLNEQMRQAGWVSRARVFYRDGSEVEL